MARQQLDGLVIAVTGGASGIGRQIAARAAWAGAHVAIGDRDLDAAAATAEQLDSGSTAHGPVRAYRLDVTDESSYRVFLDTVTTDFGPIDVLVNNAGVMWVGPFDAEPEKAGEAMFAVNVLGVIRGIRLVAPRMRARGSGHIITIASAASKLAPPGEATYAASKHAVLGYLTGVREELRGSGVTISAILPGVVDTALAAGTDTGAARLLSPDEVAETVVRVMVKPRFLTTVPRYIGPLVAVGALLPQRLRDIALRHVVPDQVAASAKADRRAYEKRALD